MADPESPPGPLRVRVACRRDEAEDIVSFVLAPDGGGALPAWSPGAHVDVYLPNGLVRPYSLYDGGLPGTFSIAVLKEPASRGGSASLHETIAEGAVLALGAPRNLFPLAPDAAKSILLAGGIGITPLLAMADALAAAGADFTLHYCARNAARMAFRGRLAEGAYAERVRFHLDDGPAEQQLRRDEILANPGPGHHLYVCGPAGFIEAALDAARAAGWHEDCIHVERFAAPAPEGGSLPFEIVLARSGTRVTVAAAESAVAALARAGIGIPVSCEQGVCGTCITGVISGEPDHRDLYLMPEERAAGRLFMPCCSRAKGGTLVLDL